MRACDKNELYFTAKCSVSPKKKMVFMINISVLKPGVGNRPAITYATPEPGRLVCVISLETGVRTLQQSVRKWRKIYLSPFIVPRWGLTIVFTLL